MKKIKEFLVTVVFAMILMGPMYWLLFLTFDASEEDPDWWRFWKRRKALKKKEGTDNDLEDWVEDLD